MTRDTDDERATLRRSSPDELGPETARMPTQPDPRRAVGAALERPLDSGPGNARYEPIELLGQGGMGEVRRSFDAKIGREIAVKTMLPTSPRAMAQARARFLREARVQALLEHPAIVPVYDIGDGPGGLAYFTMKRIRGQTLAELIEAARLERSRSRGPRTGLRRWLVHFVTVCLAIDYAHEHGVVHRDLKPDNVMLGPHGEVYVLDWGVAKIVGAGAPQERESAEVDTATRPGEMVGTPGYMPPEQVLGHHQLVDARSDVYALGAMLYELVTLEPLHPGPLAKIMEATLSPGASPKPPEDAPLELVAIALGAARFRMEDRAPSARAIADAIERYLDGDRDEDARRRIAKGRAEEARRHASLALSEIGEHAESRLASRAAAMREAGKALALEPDNELAASVVLDLLAAPPAEIPKEAQHELDELEEQHLHRAMRDNALRMAAWLVAVPLPFLLGLKSPAVVSGIGALYAACLATAFVLYRRRITSSLSRVGFCALTSVFVGSLAALYGPFVIVPAVAGMNTVLFSGQARSRERPAMIAFGALAVTVPLALELLGLVPPSMHLDGEHIVIVSRVTEVRPALTFAFLVVVSLLGVVTPTLLAGRLREALLKAERDLVVQKWQLAQVSFRRG